MSYLGLETSRQSGEPAELYRFFVGPTAFPDGLSVPPPPLGSGVFVFQENWTYADTPAAMSLWVPQNPGSLVGGSPSGGTAGSFTMNDLQFIGPLGSGGGKAWHQRTITGLNPACRYLIKVTVTRNRLTGWFFSGLAAEGLDTPIHAGGGIGPSTLWVAPFPKPDGTIRVLFGLFLVEWNGFRDNPLDLTLGPLSIERLCDADPGDPPPTSGGSGIAFHYTSADEDLVYKGDLYRSALLVRERLRYADEDTRDGELMLEVAADHPIATQVCLPPPAPPTTCTIYRLHRADLTDAATPIRGLITQKKIVGNRVQFTLTPNTRLFERRLPLLVQQKSCPYLLHGPLCQASKIGHAVSLGVSAVSGKAITVTGAAAAAAAFPTRFREGVLVAPNGSRSGIQSFDARQTGDVVTLYAANPAVLVGSTVTLEDGCDKQVGTCHTLFANLPRHGGWPVMPPRNPGTGAGLN